MEYLIRPAQPADMPELLLLMEAHADYEKAQFDPGGKAGNLIKAIFDTPTRLYCLVIDVHGRLEGYASYTYDFSTWDAAEFMYMDCLYLTEKTRGMGIGTAVLNQLKQIGRERGCVNIQWQTPYFNKQAIRFYRKNDASDLKKARFTFVV